MMNKLPEFNFFMDDHAIAPRDLYFDFKKETLTFNIEITNSYLLNNIGRFYFSMKLNEDVLCKLIINKKDNWNCRTMDSSLFIFHGLPVGTSNFHVDVDDNKLPTEDKVKPFIIEPIRDFGISEDACQVENGKTNQICMEVFTSPKDCSRSYCENNREVIYWKNGEKIMTVHVIIHVLDDSESNL